MGFNPESINAAVGKGYDQQKFETQEDKAKGDLEKRVEANIAKFRAQHQELSQNEPVILKAKELLEKYGKSNDIPEEELDIDKSGFDDARLLGLIKIIEEKQ